MAIQPDTQPIAPTTGWGILGLDAVFSEFGEVFRLKFPVGFDAIGVGIQTRNSENMTIETSFESIDDMPVGLQFDAGSFPNPFNPMATI